jgi:hypothetical protein
MPDLSLLEGAGILLSGMLAGRFWPARRRGRKPPKPVTPTCGCNHNVSYHDPKTGRCHKISSYDGSQCPCRRYTGPEPLPEYYAPEIT